MAARDWLEGITLVLGAGFFLLGAVCARAIVVGLANLGDAEAPPGTTIAIGSLEATRGFAIVLFAVFGFVALGVGWFLAGTTIRRWLRRSRRPN